MLYKNINIKDINDNLIIRSIKAYGVEQIKSSIDEIGYISDKPIVIVETDNGYKVIAGNHRLEACKKSNIDEIPAIIYEKDELDEEHMIRFAVQSNESSEVVIPTTFVDWAELVWDFLKKDGMTQQKLADILGWSREKVAQFNQLKKISEKAWDVVVTTFTYHSNNNSKCDVTEDVTNVTSIFSEGLLRNILSLKPKQQYELVKDLADDKIKKNKFIMLSKAYKYRNELKKYLIKEIGGYGLYHLKKAFREVDKGAYDKAKGDVSVLNNLIKQIKDEWEKKNSVTLYNGDFIQEVEKIPSETIDLIITDPPYNLKERRTFRYTDNDGRKARNDRSFKFDDWDDEDSITFLHNFTVWVKHFYRILKEKGSCYVFTGDRYISHMRKIIEDEGFKYRATLTWNKTNPGTSMVKTNFISATEYVLFFTKCESGHTFNWDSDEFSNMLTFFTSTVCSGNERYKNSKNEILHPTQKPEKPIERFIEISSNYGDIVFDGFMGVGTIPSVAKKRGRKVIAIEKDKEYFEVAKKRLGDIR
jgi:site-specific DNA-methyltransferase (adenine-specific)